MRLIPRSRRGRTLALVYLALVAATVLLVLAAGTILASADGGADMTAIWLVLVTLPWSVAVVAFTSPEVPDGVVLAGLALSGLLNARILGWLGDRSAR